MSMQFNMQDDFSLARRQARGRLFGSCIEKTREAGGRSVEEAAHLAGMEASQWAAIEDGYVPVDSTQLRSIAGTLECGYEKIALLAFICQGAWEQ
jgi:transcriptional regulator with XRE-family HTH domain